MAPGALSRGRAGGVGALPDGRAGTMALSRKGKGARRKDCGGPLVAPFRSLALGAPRRRGHARLARDGYQHGDLFTAAGEGAESGEQPEERLRKLSTVRVEETQREVEEAERRRGERSNRDRQTKQLQ